MVDVAELLVALPGQGDFVAVIPGAELSIEPGGLFVGEVFGADLQGSTDSVERVALAAAVSQGVLLDPAADLVDHGRAELHDMERVQNGDGFGQLVTDRVRVAAERIQRGGLDPGSEPCAAFFEPVRIGLPRPARNQVKQPGVHHPRGVAGVVHDPGDHAGSGRAGVGPDMLIDPERIYPGQPAGRCDPPGGFDPDRVPDGVPGDVELMGQGGDRGVEMLERIGRPPGGPGGELRPWSCQRVLLCERRSRAVRVRAPPDTFGPQQPHRAAETGNVMETDLAASMPDRDDAAVGAAGDVLPGFDAQKQAGTGCRDGADADALDTEQRIRARAPAATGTRHRVIHVRVSFGYWLLGRDQFKEALTSFLPHHAAAACGHALPPASDGPHPAHRRRPKATGFPANAAAGAGLLRPPDCVHANVEQLPLTDVRDDPDKSVFRKRHVNPPVPQCPGFMIPHSDAVPAGQGQEDFDFAFCQRLFQPIPPRRCAEMSAAR